MKKLNNQKTAIVNRNLSGKEVFSVFQTLAAPLNVSLETPSLDTCTVVLKTPFPHNTKHPIFAGNTPYKVWKQNADGICFIFDIKSGKKAAIPQEDILREGKIVLETEICGVNYRKDTVSGFPRLYPRM